MKLYKNESVYKSTFQMFLDEIAVYPLLTIEEETHLLNEVSNGRYAIQMLEELNDDNSISASEYRELVKLKEKALKAKEKLVNCNMRLVVSIALEYKNSGLQLMDIIQEGSMGLAHAIDKFEPSYDNRLSTYVTYWIKQNITRAIDNQKRTIRIPTHMLQEINRFNKTISLLKADGVSNPTDEEIAKAMGISVKRVKNLYEWDKDSTSLDKVVNDEDGSSLDRFIASEDSSPSEVMNNTYKNEAVLNLINSLPERERDVIMLRYGFIDGVEYTLDEIGKKMNVTRERIRQIESRAIRLMRSSEELDSVRVLSRSSR